MHPSANIHPVPFAGLTAEDAARVYEHTLKNSMARQRSIRPAPYSTLIFWASGEDGIPPRFFPGTSALTERERWVVP